MDLLKSKLMNLCLHDLSRLQRSPHVTKKIAPFEL